ncbi:alpha/beta fold hydrolase [Priestia filamentosa]|uniref:alpha/beta fold hydrolase n=1 Tax=Priestia filamentosa TaxID=1402861 RepID=UPI00397E0A86
MTIMPYIQIGRGEPIIFLHGLGNNYHLWDLQHELASKYTLIIPDLRGHGGNPLKTNINLHNLATDVFQLMDFLSIWSANICGLSMGGLIAFEMYKQSPTRIQSLILSNTTPYCIPWLISPSVYENIRIHDEKDTINSIVNRSTYKKGNEIIQHARRSFTLHKEAFIETSQHCSKANYLSVLPFINSPTLIINGLRDLVTPPLLSYQIKAGIPHSRFRTLVSGHLANIECKDEFNVLLDEFIEEKEVLKSNLFPLFYN